MPRLGKPAARMALPQPPNVSQNVPKNSAARRRDMSFGMAVLTPFEGIESVPRKRLTLNSDVPLSVVPVHGNIRRHWVSDVDSVASCQNLGSGLFDDLG